jgi:hypothetical protein
MANNMVGQMKIRLAQHEMDRTNLQIEAKGICRSISSMLVPELAEVEEMDIATAAAYMDRLVMIQGELLGLQRKIWELEKALGS